MIPICKRVTGGLRFRQRPRHRDAANHCAGSRQIPSRRGEAHERKTGRRHLTSATRCTCRRAGHETLRDGTTVLIRPIREGDESLERQFIERLSQQSRRYRFLGTIKGPSPTLLRQLTHPEAARGVAYIALLGEGPTAQEIGVCRYSASADGLKCECAVTVSDEWQDKGLATILMRHLIDTARQAGIEHMYSIDACDNQRMRELAGHLGFQRRTDPQDPTLVIHSLELQRLPS